MAERREGTIGIMPAGALGVAFLYHLTGKSLQFDGEVFFIEREGSASGKAMRAAGLLRIDAGGQVHELRGAGWFQPSLPECAAAGWLPEIVLVCTQPDQLLGVMAGWVRLFELLHAWHGERAAEKLPVMMMMSNGIYFQRVRQFLIEKLEESTLLGRLPDLWPDEMPRVVGSLLRGVTIQTGQRVGAGAEAIYRPGLPGRTRVAGGDRGLRQRATDRLSTKGMWVEMAGEVTPTRVEFDKALINLAANLLGQLQAIDDAGRFRPLTLEEIFDGECGAEVDELIRHVVAVGKAVRAYAAEESDTELGEQMRINAVPVGSHVPSSLQWIEGELSRGTLQPRLTPTEAWLVEPLIRYAHAAGLEESAHYFEALTRRVERRLALAVAARSRG
jgi:hypothetical protein